jgi:trk system potassium uptake protein
MQEAMPSGPPSGLKWSRQILHPLLALAMAACLLSLVGWTGTVNAWQHWATTIGGIVFAAQRWLVFSHAGATGRERRRLLAHLVLGVMVLVVSAALLAGDLSGQGSRAGMWHVAIQLGILACGLASMIHHQTRFTAKAFHPGLVLIGSFFAIIVAGTLLLKMPRCVLPGQHCSWLDAAFTSTSAVCVTGLAVQNTATFFSLTGQTVILLLIQIGGLGIMTLTFFAAVVLFEGLSLHDRLLLGRMMSDNRLSRIGHTLTFIVSMTFICEAIGAAVLFATLRGEMAMGERLFHSVFHSVSAFCNAGFSTFTDGLASEPLRANAAWQSCIMVLIVIGGIGALVAEDLSKLALAGFHRLMGRPVGRTRLRIHTRLVVATTLLLIFGGAAAILLSEFVLWRGPENGGRVLTAMFHSVTARTAGFNTVPMGAIGPVTVQILIILMLIGGSPGGTAGGVRTTVVAVAIGHLWNQLRSSRRGMVVFNRTIPPEAGAQALGLLLLAGIWLTANYMVFRHLEAGSAITDTRLLFELISAFATVGLSLDLTPLLSDGGKTLLIVNMFVGRLGLLTVLATLVPPDLRPASGKPTENILLN